MTRCIIYRLTSMAAFSIPTVGYTLSVHDSLVAGISSDWVYHGTSETNRNATLHLTGELQIGQRSFIGATLHEGEVGSENKRDGKSREQRQQHRGITLYTGYGFTHQQWYYELSYRYRNFPDSVKDWDYNEWSALLANDFGISLSVDYADNYYRHKTQATVTQLHIHRPLIKQWYWQGTVGAVELSRKSLVDNRFANAGMGFAINHFAVELTYHWNSENLERFRLPVTSPKWVISFSYQLR